MEVRKGMTDIMAMSSNLLCLCPSSRRLPPLGEGRSRFYNTIALAVLLSIPGIVAPTGAPIYVGSVTTNFFPPMIR